MLVHRDLPLSMFSSHNDYENYLKGKNYHLRNSTTGVNTAAIMQNSVETCEVGGGNRIATVFASARGDLTTANFCMRVMMMSLAFKP